MVETSADGRDYRKALKKFHKTSDRHVLVLETDMPYQDAQKILAISDRIRKAGNELVHLMLKNYTQLMRTKKYRKLLGLYRGTEDGQKRRELARQLNGMRESYRVTWDFCRKSMAAIKEKYSIDAIFALTKAEDIWRGMLSLIHI